MKVRGAIAALVSLVALGACGADAEAAADSADSADSASDSQADPAQDSHSQADSGAAADGVGPGEIWQPAPGTTWHWQLQGTLPAALDVAMLDLDLFGKRISWVYHVENATHAPRKIVVNGVRITAFQTLENPYRAGGLSLDGDPFNALLNTEENTVEIYI